MQRSGRGLGDPVGGGLVAGERLGEPERAQRPQQLLQREPRLLVRIDQDDSNHIPHVSTTRALGISSVRHPEDGLIAGTLARSRWSGACPDEEGVLSRYTAAFRPAGRGRHR